VVEQSEQDKRVPILCPRTNKVLAYIDKDGIYLFCRERGCYQEHRFAHSAINKTVTELGADVTVQ